MKRREFLRNSALLTVAAVAAPKLLPAAEHSSVEDTVPAEGGSLIISAPMLQNYAQTSVGVAFAVSALANGYVIVGEKEDLSDGRKVMCGGFRVTDVNDKVMLVRLTGLKPSTKYYYRIGAHRISFKGGYKMKILGTEEDPVTYITPDFFDRTGEVFCRFLKENEGKAGKEFDPPFVFDCLIKEGRGSCEVLSTPSHWFGVTYKEDRPGVVARFAELVKAGVYPTPLWK